MRVVAWRQIPCRQYSCFRKCSHRVPLLPADCWQYHRHLPHRGGFQSRFTSQVSALRLNGRSSVNETSNPINLDEQLLLNDILDRATTHGIETLEQLQFQADVGHLRFQGSKLTDLAASRQDLGLWSVLLEFRYLKDGIRGVADILFGMRSRGNSVKLYYEDLVSERIWQKLLPIVVQDNDLLTSCCNSSEGLAREIPSLCVDVLGLLLLRGDSGMAQRKTRQLGPKCRGKEDLVALFNLALHSENTVSMDDFWRVYRRLPPAPEMYGHIVPHLWANSRAKDALLMHSNLLKRGDFPSSFEHIEGIIRHYAHEGKPLQAFLDELSEHGISYTAQARRLYWEETQIKAGTKPELLGLLEGHSMRRHQRLYTDQFVARAFATASLSFEFVLRFMTILGVRELGPQSMRQIATSAGDIQTLRKRLQGIENSKIDTGASAVAALVKRLCEANCEQILFDILTSDQHHEVFEDIETQKRLLAEFYYRKDMRAVNRTLAVLNRGNLDASAQEKSFHLLFQAAVILRDWRGVLTLLTDRRRHGNTSVARQRVLNTSLTLLINHLSPSRRRSDDTGRQYLDEVQYTIGLLQNLESSGVKVELSHWRRILWRLGYTYSWERLEKLCSWLAWYYCRNNSSVEQSRMQSKPIDDLFDTDFQAAVILWSCAMSSYEEQHSRIIVSPEQRGIILLRKLESNFDMTLEYGKVKDAYLGSMNLLPFSVQEKWMYTRLFDTIWHGNARISFKLDSENGAAVHGDNLFQKLRAVARPSFDKDSPNIDGNPEGLSIARGDQDKSDRVKQDRKADVVEYRDLFHPSSQEYKR